MFLQILKQVPVYWSFTVSILNLRSDKKKVLVQEKECNGKEWQMPDKWWSYVLRCFCRLSNDTTPLSEVSVPWTQERDYYSKWLIHRNPSNE